MIAVWAIDRRNDRYDDFMGVYTQLGLIWPDLEMTEYLSLFRMSKESFEWLYG